MSSSEEPPKKKRRNEKKTFLSKKGGAFDLDMSFDKPSSEGGSDVDQISEKERCVELLQFLIELLSADFSFWSRRPRNPQVDLRHSRSSPLIARIFWPHGTSTGFVNQNCKTLFHFFAKALSEKEMVLAQDIGHLVSMVGEVSYLSDLEPRTKVAFPRENARGFASSLEIALQDLLNTEEDIEFCLNFVRPSWLLMEVADKCMMRMEPNLWRRHMKLRELVILPFFNDIKGSTSTSKNVQSSNNRSSRRGKPTGSQEPPPLAKVENRAIAPSGRQGKNTKGESKLHIACQKDDSAKVRELLRMPGVDVNARDNAGWTALHDAAARGAAECVRLLLNHKVDTLMSFFKSPKARQKDGTVDVAATGPGGRTALHIAVEYGHADIARVLLKYAGDALFQLENEAGYTAEELCEEEPLKEVFRQYRDRHDLVDSQSQSNGIYSSPKKIRPGEIRGESSSAKACLKSYIGAYVAYFRLNTVWTAIYLEAGRDEDKLEEALDFFSEDFDIMEYYREMKTFVNKFHNKYV